MHESLSPNPIVDAELLRAFAAFAEDLNFTRAARRVALSQPALFERVQRLADAMGRPLYTREGRALALTPAGVRAAAYARDTLAQARAFLADDDASGGRERVVLAAGEGAYLYLLGPALAQFARTHDAALEVRTLGGPSALAAVASGEAHVAVGAYDLVPERMVSVDIVTTPLCVAVRRGHRLAQRSRVRIAELADETLIVAPAGQRHRDLVGRAVAGVGRAVTKHIEADGWPLMLAFAAAGLGVAIVNGICAPPPGVVLVRVPELGAVTYRALRRRNAPESPAVTRLVRLIASSRT